MAHQSYRALAHHQNGTVIDPGATVSRKAVTWQRREEGTRRWLVAVNRDGFTTSIIADRLQQAINLFDLMGIERIVLNTSFVIVPCRANIGYEAVLQAGDI